MAVLVVKIVKDIDGTTLGPVLEMVRSQVNP